MSTVRIPLKSRNYPGHFALIDEEDYENVAKHTWCVFRPTQGQTLYAVAYIGEGFRAVFLHRFVFQSRDGYMPDHISGDGLDCRKANLREATQTQNKRNRRKHRHSTQPYKGIRRQRGKWIALITVDGQVIRSHACSTAEEAARVYDRLAIQHHGTFARTNFESSSSVLSAPPGGIRDVATNGRDPCGSGEQNGNAKLTTADVLAIRTRYAEGKSNQREIAAAYGVGQTTISKILRGKSWPDA